MKAHLSFWLFLALVSSLEAQTILLKNGQTVPANDIQRKGDLLMVSVTSPTGSKGLVGYALTEVATLNLPPPPEIAAASDLISKGHADEALAKMEPVVAFQQSLRGIPGNWWSKTALVKSSALVALNQGAIAAPILKDIAGDTADPDTQLDAKLQLALLEPSKDPAEALAAYDAVITQSTAPKTLSQAWLAVGDLHFAQHEFSDALLAYLTITVFYSDHNPLVPRALWGVAQCYAKLKDGTNSDLTFHEIITTYPDNPEAALAQAELKKEENK